MESIDKTEYYFIRGLLGSPDTSNHDLAYAIMIGWNFENEFVQQMMQVLYYEFYDTAFKWNLSILLNKDGETEKPQTKRLRSIGMDLQFKKFDNYIFLNEINEYTSRQIHNGERKWL